MIKNHLFLNKIIKIINKIFKLLNKTMNPLVFMRETYFKAFAINVFEKGSLHWNLWDQTGSTKCGKTIFSKFLNTTLCVNVNG